LNFIAACAFGLEAIVKRELLALGYQPHVAQPGRIRFSGDESAICQTNLWLRTADRVLIEVLQFDAPDFDALFETVKEFDWSEFLPRDAAFPVNGKSRLSQLTSVPAVQRTVKKAIVDSLKKFHATDTLDESGPQYGIEVALLNDVATITLDTTGPSLHKRGYRQLSAVAPIKETLAAALIDLSVWNPERLLVDPFCGSGTIPIEAALIGLNIAPGLNRTFSSSDWGMIHPTLWVEAVSQAQDAIIRDRQLQIIGTDRDPDVLSLARFHAEKAGVADQIHFQQKSFEELRSKREYGCIVTNPPYGERLEDQYQLENLYLSIPGVMQRLPTWSLFLITNMPNFESMIQRRADRRRKLFNGRLECTYYQFLGPRPPRRIDVGDVVVDKIVDVEVDGEVEESNALNERVVDEEMIQASEIIEIGEDIASTASIEALPQSLQLPNSPARDLTNPRTRNLANPREQKPIFKGVEPKDNEQAELFHNRLTNRARHLRRWPTKRGITCYRLYERDIPEIPLVVDRYEDSLHITEYERPHERDLARHAAWLELMKKTAAATLEIPIQNVFLKKRLKNRDTGQYHKFDSRGNLIPVQESGLTFLVNLQDYVDTGLFLDHRQTRQMVYDEAANTDFLNLFAYTGSFSVYAAAAGARSTTTVDLSRTYLDWAQKNFAANKLSGPQHKFIAGDVLEFLTTNAGDPRCRFDLAVVDPPTYSNSKRTETDWDVQRGHVELLNALRLVMRPAGVVYFSTNFRRFKLAETEIEGFEFREISRQTVPEDFRNTRIHRCWRMEVRQNVA